MKHHIKIFISGCLLAASSYANAESYPDSVYVCTGNFASAYHIDAFCNGLSNCGGTTRKIHRSKLSKKRKLCKLCAKRHNTVNQTKNSNSKNKSKKNQKRKKGNSKKTSIYRDVLTEPF